MIHFELRFHDNSNALIFMRAYIGADDLAALAEAERLSETHVVEVWEGTRKVARVKKGNIALANTDRVCG